MSQNTFPAFTDMMPEVEDIQLIVDSLREEDKCRITKDRVFMPGIVNEPDTYLSLGSKDNSLKIKPFVAYTSNGNRIEVDATYDDLYAVGNVINVTDENKKSSYENIPVWSTYYQYYSNLSNESLSQSLTVATLGRGSILHGIKVRINSKFGITGLSTQPNIYISIGTSSEPEKFLPKTNVSVDASSTNLSIMNLMYSIDDDNPTDMVVTYSSDSVNLNTLTNGSITINLCIADLSGFDNSDSAQSEGGYLLDNNQGTGTWQANTTYHIVVRYQELKDNYRGLNYTTKDGSTISTTPEATRLITSYNFYALRKTGAVIDYTTLDDVKIGEVVTGNSGEIINININGKNVNGDNYTDYLTIPGYRFIENINANQIGNGNVTNEQFDYLSNITSDVQSQLNSKAGLKVDNTFTGENTFTKQIKGSIDKVNGFTAEQTPTSNSLLVLDSNGKVPSNAISESTFASIGNFYTVSSGVTTLGRASFLEANATENGVTIIASEENPLILNYPNGAVEKITEEKDIQGLFADGYYYLVKEQNGNFNFLPTAGGTMACIPTINSGTSFPYGSSDGEIAKSYLPNDGTTHLAFDGTISTGALMGKVTYKNYSGIENTSYLPAGSVNTSIEVTFPEAITLTGIALCFRKNKYDITPKVWELKGSNDDGETWSNTIISSSNSTWNIDEIKTLQINTAIAYKKFKLTFIMQASSLNNYMIGEQTDEDGTTMSLNCYYFQLYATNTDSNIKGSIVEGYTKPSNMSAGSYFLDISKKPYIGYKCTDTDTFVETNYVKLGFVNITGFNTDHTVIDCYPFCYNTFTTDDAKSVNLNEPIVFNHNLGVVPNIIQVKYICNVDNNGYTEGDYINNLYMKDTIGTSSISDVVESTVTYVKIRPGSLNSTLYVKDKTSGELSTISNGDWKAIIYCSRGW